MAIPAFRLSNFTTNKQGFKAEVLSVRCFFSLITYIALLCAEIDPPTGSTGLVKQANFAFRYTIEHVM